jgi:MFS family permease
MTRRRAATPLALGALVFASLLLRTQRLGVNFWIDEALSVGIADRPLADIPSALRLDGSPPLYYSLLHVWMRLVGERSEEATHALSLVIALMTIPVAFVLMRSLLSERAGWCAAVLAAVNPFLTQYAQETRMYALVVLLGTVACAAFVGTFVLARGREWPVAFALSLTALLYTHNWALFFGAATGIAWLVLLARDRALLRPGLVCFGTVALLYAPWVPTLLFQAAHTGAPWAKPPTLEHLTLVPGHLLGRAEVPLLILAVAVAIAGGLRRHPHWRAFATLLGVFAGTILIAWLMSLVSPAWATRYLAIGLPPLLLATAAAVAHAGRAGVVALALAAVGSLAVAGPPTKSNVANVAAEVAPGLRAGDLVISTQPEQAPNLAYYLREVPGLRWATIFGPLTELGVTDWRDGVKRMERLTPERDLAPLLDALPRGARVVLVQPEIYNLDRWSAPWTKMVRIRSNQWLSWMLNDPRFRVTAVRPEEFDPPAPNPVRATVFLKSGIS